MVDGFQLPEHLSDVSLRALGTSTRHLLAVYLDPPSACVDSDGFASDASGLSELAGFDVQTIRFFESKSSRTLELLNMWRYKENGTLGHLVRHLVQLERYDCLSEILQKLVTDANKWTRRSRGRESQGSIDSSNGNTTAYPNGCDVITDADSSGCLSILTVDDVEGDLQMYSACVCCADDDLDLARAIALELSATTRIFIPQDHLVGGAYEFEATAEVIEDRCDGRLIVLLSNQYTSSPACSFATQFAKTLDPDARRRRIIPVVKEEGVQFPRILRGISTIKHYRCESMASFLRQILASLSCRTPGSTTERVRHDSRISNASMSSSRSSVDSFRKLSDVSASSTMSDQWTFGDRRTSNSSSDNGTRVTVVTGKRRSNSPGSGRLVVTVATDKRHSTTSYISEESHMTCQQSSGSAKILNINPQITNVNETSLPGSSATIPHCTSFHLHQNVCQFEHNNLSPTTRNANNGQVNFHNIDTCHPRTNLNTDNCNVDLSINRSKDSYSSEDSTVQHGMKSKSKLTAIFKRVFKRTSNNKIKNDCASPLNNIATISQGSDGEDIESLVLSSDLHCEAVDRVYLPRGGKHALHDIHMDVENTPCETPTSMANTTNTSCYITNSGSEVHTMLKNKQQPISD